MISDALLCEADRAVREKTIEFVKAIPTSLLLDMDADRIRYPKEFLKLAAKFDLLGLRFPKEYSGKGLGWSAEVVALEEIGVLGTALACLYSLVSIVGEAINTFGTEEQKLRFLKPTIEAKIATAEGLTEPRSGSDFFGATTVAKREGNHFILRGQKRFIVGGEGADYFLVYAKTDPDAEPHKSMTAFLVERDKNVKVKHVYGLMGTRGGGTARVAFDNVKVPLENVLGGEKGINRGADVFYQMMVPERMTSAAGALGMARAALQIAADYSTKRKSFGKPIKSYQAVSFKVADSITKLDAARALVYETAKTIDSKVEEPSRIRRLVSESKAFATRMAWEVVNDAMQIMGGIGYTNVYPIERLLRDTRLIMIWTGTNEIMNLIIQHEYYKELKESKNLRNVEQDAENAKLEEEKIYE